MARANPLTSPPPEEVHLQDAPLVRVLAQVRFPPILSIAEKSFVASFQESIRDQYPILRPEKTRSFVFGPQGVDSSEELVWRFLDLDHVWRVTLAPSFLALETTSYLSRTNFLSRFQEILSALNSCINPKITERLGLRYIARLENDDLEQITELVQPEVSGILTDLGSHVDQSISESIFSFPEGKGQMLARWGVLPPGATIDPSAIEPIDQRSWILDLDLSISKERSFNLEQMMSEFSYFAERQYTFFRWAVKDAFLSRFGGEQ
ncbi:MAG: TIGR04255 family protein [Synechococcaceae cyanobacterium SM2_3_2]|nr:TIGR04255 family protein [Synechococcaceae cyanobacterium SM2_3_2]